MLLRLPHHCLSASDFVVSDVAAAHPPQTSVVRCHGTTRPQAQAMKRRYPLSPPSAHSLISAKEGLGLAQPTW